MSTRFRRVNGPLGSSSERRVLVGNFPESERSWMLLFDWIADGRPAIIPAMAVEHLFTQAPGLATPWTVVTYEFDPVAGTLELVMDFERGTRFPDPETGELCPVYDTVQRSWEHLGFFEHRTTIRARVPRMTTPSGAVKTAEVSRQTSVSGDRIWHLLRSRIGEAWKQADWSSLERLGVDETSTRKDHKYGTAFLEIKGKETQRGRGASTVARLLFLTPGKDKGTFSEFVAELERGSVPATRIEEIAMDMSKAFIAGAGEHFPTAQMSFDRFHVMKLCGESLDQIRKEVARENGGLPRGAMGALRGNPENLKEQQRELREQICKEHGKIARALSIREFLADLWNYQHREDAEKHLDSVMSWCGRSRMQPFVKLAKTLKRHKDGILGYFNTYTTSAAIEAVNGLRQLARRRARGYRTFRNFQAMAYWIAGGLTIEIRPTPTHEELRSA